MKPALFDTNIIIDYARGIEQAQKVISTCPRRVISIITWMEFLVGMPLERIEPAEKFLDENFEIMPIDIKISQQAIIIRKNFKMKLPDAIIYASAKIADLPLITRNTKDFNPDWPDVIMPYDLSVIK